MGSQKISIRIYFRSKTTAVEFVNDLLPSSGISYVLITTTKQDGSEVYYVSSVIDMSSVSIEMLHYLKQQLSILEVLSIYISPKESEERKENE